MRVLVLLLLIVLLPLGAEAQNASPPPAGANESVLKPGQLDALVAPIALYPDTLLAQTLMASTYPLEVVQADRWVADRKNLDADALKKEAEKQGWDDSVKSLVATPSVLTMMSQKLDWTQKLGDAFLAQQPDVMDAIQRLRSKAYANDKLKSTKEQNVAVRKEADKQVVTIVPTDPQTIYVPYYDPQVVFDPWPYPDYPPYYYYPEGYLPGVIATGLAFGTGYAIWRWASGGRWWNGGIDWGNRNIDINRGGRVEHWRHNPQHRRGVAYTNPNVRQNFAGGANRPGTKGQPEFRGSSGKQVLKPGGEGPKGGQKAKQAGKGKGPQTKQAAQGKRPQTKQAAQGKRPQAKQAAQGKRPTQAGRAPQQRVAQHRQPQRVQQRAAPRGGGPRVAGYSSRNMGGGRSFGGGGRSFGGRGGGGRGGGRRSDVRLKHDITLLGRLDNGLGLYRFAYNGGTRMYVGVMAQEVQAIAPAAVVRGRDGYLRVDYGKLGLQFQSYERWIASGGHIPSLPAAGQAGR